MTIDLTYHHRDSAGVDEAHDTSSPTATTSAGPGAGESIYLDCEEQIATRRQLEHALAKLDERQRDVTLRCICEGGYPIDRESLEASAQARAGL